MSVVDAAGGTTLRTVLTQSGRLAPDRAIAVIDQVARELDAARIDGSGYREAIDPSEIMVTPDGSAHLAPTHREDASATAAQASMGRAAYMAPERLLANAAPSKRTEVYALAGVLYECLTGTTPYAATGGLPGLIAALQTAPVPSPSQHVAGLSAAFDEVLTRGLAKNPDARYPTADDLVAAARDALGEPAQDDAAPLSQWKPSTTPEPPPPPIHPGPPATSVILGPPAAPFPVPPQPAASPDADHRRRRTRRTLTIVAAVAVAAAVVAAVIGVLTVKVSQPDTPGWGAEQTALPFGTLHSPHGIAVDTAGNVYVVDFETNAAQRGRVLKLAVGADQPTQLPFPDLNIPYAIAVDTTDSVYVSGTDKLGVSRVWKLAANATSPVDLPFTGVPTARGLAVDSEGTIYVADYDRHQLMKLAVNATNPTEVPLPGLQYPEDIAVTADGAIYVTNGSHTEYLSILPAGATTPTPVFTGKNLSGVAVSSSGNVYASDDIWLVWRLKAGSSEPSSIHTELQPSGVAVDTAGAVYITVINGTVSDGGQVLKLASG
ncbi:MAG: hypothetical protein H6523_15080 [Mycolicibacterium sp.]|nr:hypothetical protein [Mycolicibacterium sp.]